MYIIQTKSRVITGFKDRDSKTEAQPRFFIEALYSSCKHAGEVCIIFKLKDKIKDGRKEAVQHKASISEEDCKRLKDYFANAATSLNVKKVTHYVWFHITLYFCLRGGELQSKLKRTDLEFTPGFYCRFLWELTIALKRSLWKVKTAFLMGIMYGGFY